MNGVSPKTGNAVSCDEPNLATKRLYFSSPVARATTSLKHDQGCMLLRQENARLLLEQLLAEHGRFLNRRTVELENMLR